MANSWLRLWHDMPNDPKFRVIAKASGQPISLVIALYISLLVDASKNTESRGVTQCHDEDLAVTLDCDIAEIEQIKTAMQGRLLDGNTISGWDKRQPKREDSGGAERGSKSAAERQAAKRERDRLAKEEQEETQCHAVSRNVTTDKDKEESKPKSRDATATRLPADWKPDDLGLAFCKSERPDLDPTQTAARFRDYWAGIAGAKGKKLDWTATWRNWVRAENSPANPVVRAVPSIFAGAR